MKKTDMIFNVKSSSLQALDQIDSKHFRLGVVAVFINASDEVLLFQRTDRPDEWQFPQGGVKKNETFIQALQREVLEETSIDRFEVIQKATETVRYLWPKPRKFLYGQEQTWFKLTLPSNIKINLTKADDSFLQYQWIKITDIWPLTTKWKHQAYEFGLSQLGLLKKQKGL